MFKKVVLALSIIYLVTGYQVSYLEKLGDNVDNLLEKLQYTVDGTVNEAEKNISLAKKNLNEEVAKMQEELQEKIDSYRFIFEEDFKEVKEFAANYAVNIDDCLKEKDDGLNNLSAEILKENTECISPYLQNATSIINTAYAVIQKVHNQVYNIRQAVAECQKSTESTSCLAKISFEIEEDMIKIPTTLQDATKDVTDYIYGNVDQIYICGKRLEVVDQVDAVYLLNKTTRCILRKINHKY